MTEIQLSKGEYSTFMFDFSKCVRVLARGVCVCVCVCVFVNMYR